MADTKHLEFLQAVITRLAGNSFLIKGWSIGLATLALGIAVKEGGPYFALLGLLPVIVLAVLDAYYLALEDAFRDLYKTAAQKHAAGTPADFLMTPGHKVGLMKALGRVFSLSVLLIHGPLVAVLGASFFVLCEKV